VNFLAGWLADTPAAATPYALAALGLIISERGGVLTLTAEGLMLIGAVAAIGCDLTFGGWPLAALLAAMLAAAVVSLLFGALVVSLRVNQVIAGLAVVFFCEGLSTLLGTLLGWQNHPVAGMLGVVIPGLTDLPVIGRAVFGQTPVTYLVVPVFLLVDLLLRRTMAGLRLRAVGEAPAVAHSLGEPVTRIRYLAVLFGGAMSGIAGAYLSTALTPMWVEGMSAGRGWIALALVVFGTWKPWRVLGGAYLFGTVTVLQLYAQGLGVHVPSEFLSMLPYAATIVVLVVICRDARTILLNQPASLGRSFHPGY